MTSFSNFLLVLSASISVVAGQDQRNANVDFTPLLSITEQNAVGGKIYTTCNAQNNWVMTYDDGPSTVTPTLLDILDKRGIKATFFVVGSMVKDNPAVLKDAYNRGHEIGVHTWTHSHLNALDNAKVIEEAKSTYDIIKNTIGQGPLLIRPPYGEANNRVSEVLSRMGFTIVNWNVESGDATPGYSTAKVLDHVKTQLPPLDRGIVLEHDITEEYIAQTESVMDLVQAKNPTFVKISECLGVTPYGEIGLKDQVRSSEITTTPVTVTTTVPTTVPTATTTKATITSVAKTVTTLSTAPTATTTSGAAKLISNLILSALVFIFYLV